MKMNLEEAIEYLKHYIEIWSPKDSEESRAIETVLQALEKLQQDNYKLDRENQLLFESQIDSIPKKKIEDKLEELNAEFENYEVDVNCSQDNYYELAYNYEFAKEKLQELLEEK